MICHSSQASSTLKPSHGAAEATLTSNLGTMVINDDDTMKRHDTGSGKGYKPEFMAHFDKKEEQQPAPTAAELDKAVANAPAHESSSSTEESTVTPNAQPEQVAQGPGAPAPLVNHTPQDQQALQQRLQQIAGGQPLLQNQARMSIVYLCIALGKRTSTLYTYFAFLPNFN